MSSDDRFKMAAVLIALLGAGWSFATGVVPHGTGGHRLLFGAVVWGLVPYVVYVMLLEMLRRWALLVPGLFLLALDVLMQLIPAAFGDAVLTWSPLWLVVVVIPVGAFLGNLLNGSPSSSEAGAH